MHGRPRKAPKPEDAAVSAIKAEKLHSLQSQLLHNHLNKIEYLYLGGVLSSGVSTLVSLKLVSSICDDSIAIFKFELLFGLMLFVSYMFVVTQVIIEKAHRGDMDYVQHTLTFFIPDVVAVFVQILKILRFIMN